MRVALVCIAIIAFAMIVEASAVNNIVQTHKSMKSHGQKTSDTTWEMLIEKYSDEQKARINAERDFSMKFWAEHRYDNPEDLIAIVAEQNGGKIPVHPNDVAAVARGLRPKVSPHQIMAAVVKKENPNAEVPVLQDTCLGFCDRHCNDVVCDNWPGEWLGYTNMCGTIYSWVSYTHTYVWCFNECLGYANSHAGGNEQIGIYYCQDLETWYGCCGQACCGHYGDYANRAAEAPEADAALAIANATK